MSTRTTHDSEASLFYITFTVTNGSRYFNYVTVTTAFISGLII
ncbi:MAG TPA: hypothetical protein VF700_03685 [Segetibacter sp.]